MKFATELSFYFLSNNMQKKSHTHTHTEPSLDHLPQLLLEVSKLQLAWSNYKLDEQLSSKMQSDGSLLLHLLGQKSVPKQITIRSFLETYVLRC